MQALSKELQDLSDRAKKTESVVGAVRSKDRESLAQHRAELEASIAAAGTAAAANGNKASNWWTETRASVDEHFAARRAKAQQRQFEHDLKRAEQQADDAEADAADAVASALYLLDEAEHAVIDAVIARAVADDLALAR